MVENDTTASGKIYRAWMDIKSAIAESDRHSILAACEFEEDATQRGYEAALSHQSLTDPDVKSLVAEQQTALKKSHEIIKIQREAHKTHLLK